MGAFKDDLLVGDKRKYGEAVIEVRGIRHVEQWFLKKVGIDPSIKDSFLTVPEKSLIFQARKLFDFLSEFGSPQIMSDIRVGMTHAIFRL